MNVARIASLRAGVPIEASAITVNRFCSSGLQAIAYGAERIMVGGADAVVAGGTESMSLIPMGGHKVRPQPGSHEGLPGRLPLDGARRREPCPRGAGLARRAGRLRPPQPPAGVGRDRRGTVRGGAGPDRGACRRAGQRQRPAAAPRCGRSSSPPTRGRAATPRSRSSAACGRRFHVEGSVTAGNSSQMSDGAAAVVLTSRERAERAGLEPLGPFRGLRHRRGRAGAASGSDRCPRSGRC